MPQSEAMRDYLAAAAKLDAMPPAQREALDPICEAMHKYLRAYDGKGWRMLVNRVGAVDAVDRWMRFERMMMEE